MPMDVRSSRLIPGLRQSASRRLEFWVMHSQTITTIPIITTMDRIIGHTGIGLTGAARITVIEMVRMVEPPRRAGSRQSDFFANRA